MAVCFIFLSIVNIDSPGVIGMSGTCVSEVAVGRFFSETIYTVVCGVLKSVRMSFLSIFFFN